VAERKSFLLRIDAGVLEGVQRWANDDLRSLNAQIEYLLRDALRRAGRLAASRVEGPAPTPGEGSASSPVGGSLRGAPTDPEGNPTDKAESTDRDPLTDT
jgi:hypothetical protein